MKDFLLFSANDVFDNTFDNIINQIEINSPKEVLFWCLMEFEPPGSIEDVDYEKLNNICIKKNTQFYFVFSTNDNDFHNRSIKYNHSNINLLYWPTHLLHYTFDTLNINYNNEFSVNKNFEKIYLNFNRKPHYHRCLMVDELYKNGLFEYGKISWNILNDGTNHDYIPHDYKFKYWTETKLSADKYINSELTVDLLETNTFMSLTSESNEDCFFVSEKTFRSLLIEQIFYAIGSKNQNKGLEQFGFRLYDKIFDYTYDVMDNIHDRVNGVILNIKNLIDKDLYVLYDKVEDTIQYNKKRSLEIINNDPYISEKLQEMFIKYKNEFLISDIVGHFVKKYIEKHF